MVQVLKDKYGRKLGEIRDEGARQTVYDKYGARLGYFDGRCTYDKFNRKIGEGNWLATLIKD